MKKECIILFVLVALAGCANTHPAIVRSLEGKPRVQINKQVLPQPETAKLNKRE